MKQVLADREVYREMIEDLAKQIAAVRPVDMFQVQEFSGEVERRLTLLSDENMVLKGFPDFPLKRLESLREAVARRGELRKLQESLNPEGEKWITKSNMGEELQNVVERFEAAQPAIEWYQRAEPDLKRAFLNHHVPFDFSAVAATRHATVGLAAYSLRMVQTASERLHSASEEDQSKGRPQVLQLAQGTLKFAFRIHQFAGGFDAVTTQLFSSLHDVIEAMLEAQSREKEAKEKGGKEKDAPQ
ncbi:hypothetical protein T484DRAFT_1970253 [Baffinella frigidus]|nr:hypothetical protein T484DRAFT_1970253 [Cryptophyta sp. CCMP2293]